MTKEEAMAFYDDRRWERMTDLEIVKFQLYEARLCMPFSRFQEAVEKVLERPVWTHMFAETDYLRAEFEKKYPKTNG